MFFALLSSVAGPNTEISYRDKTILMTDDLVQAFTIASNEHIQDVTNYVR